MYKYIHGMETKPRYLQIVDSLEEEIDHLPPNLLLPTEQQLAKRFKVSRVTIRRALGFLQRLGKISRQRGQGTVVSPPRIVRHIVPVRALEQDLLEQGLKLETAVLVYQAKTSPPEEIRLRLDLKRKEKAGYLALLRAVHGRTICFEQRYLSPAIASHFDPALIHEQPLIHVLQRLAGMSVSKNIWMMEIVPARGDVAKALGVIPGVLTIVHTFTEYLESGAPLDAGIVSHRIDRVRFEFVASGQSLNLGQPK